MSIAKFSKVSYEQYAKDVKALYVYISDDAIRNEYDKIKLPCRSTTGSAGYDFYLPFGITFEQDPVTIPTGIRCEIEDGWFLSLYPRSGLGTKHGTRLRNVVGIVDSDYFHADNEGHIMATIVSDSKVRMGSGDRFMQGIFLPFGLADEGDVTAKRTGGYGSTDKKE